MITSLYVSLLALWLVLLSMRVIALRGNPAFAFLRLSSDDERSLDRAVRAHGNLAEYAPMMLILLYLLEVQGAGAAVVHGLGAAFLLGRLAHGMTFAFLRHSLPLRVGGMTLTLFSLLVGAVLLLLGV